MNFNELKGQLSAIEIPLARKRKLDGLAEVFLEEINKGNQVEVVFICTHNSRRSQFSQVWCQYFSDLFARKDIICYSGGTEITSVYPGVLETLKEHGFNVESSMEGSNPEYRIFWNGSHGVSIFSKLYADTKNPEKDFIAVLTCDDADENCPYIPGAKFRIPLPYKDPKFSDNTISQQSEYNKTSLLIGAEMYYMFSKIEELCK
ncbi:MAG TPA: protein-tyrosine-phosphatase [Candidatus Sphingobacterium stercoripullorum]|uniref:Protein-tyrosine-phosphatase n=1 Tax=Candidatus Sphingobacterium stercoripullorum TaxID=2838759 RepID=A0A9D2AZD1_9SPHI|nr:protein-tyrosine-phosphatase [Candidatus Sphingobacterium stercoripullorum]